MKNSTVKPRNYPYSAWVLTSAYMVKPVTFVMERWSMSKDWDQTAEGRAYPLAKIHKTKAAAIAYGRQQIVARSEYLAKQEALLDKRSAKLDKAEQV